MQRTDRKWLYAAATPLSLALGAAVWEVVGRNTSQVFMVPFSETVRWLWTEGMQGTLWQALGSSFLLFTSGFLAAILVGVPLGLLFARVRLLWVAFENYVMVLYVTPMVALIPFVMSMLGFSFKAKLLLVFLFAFFPILYNTLEGARSLKPELLEVAAALKCNERAIWLDILIPYTLPFIMTGIRLAIGRGLVGMVAAEFFLSASGIGGLIMVSSRNFDIAGVFGSILIITLVGSLLMWVGRRLEARYAVWHGA